ncbi:MAG: hypothetical protein HQK65_15345 [Desulfamplus sp.]|nr:hypothetical protein [Desulfamplus sp.]
MLNHQLPNDFFLKHPFRSKWRQTWLALPVEVYTVCTFSKDIVPEIFQTILLKLLSTGVNNITELSSISGLDNDLILYILSNEIQDKVRFVGDQVRLRSRTTIKSSKSKNVQNLTEYQMMRLTSTGRFIPRPFKESEEVWCEPDGRNKNNYPLFLYRRDKGSPVRNISPLIIPEVRFGSQSEEKSLSDDILTTWEEYLIDYDASVDFYGESETKESAGRRYLRPRKIQSLNFEQRAFILTTIMVDDSEDERWSCSDPFMLYKERGLQVLKKSVELFLQNESNNPIAQIISREINEIRGKGNTPVATDLALYYEAEDEIIARYGEKLPESLHRYLRTMLIKKREFNESPSERRRDRGEALLIEIQKTLESLLQNTWKDSEKQCLERFKKENIPTTIDRIEELSVILENLGAENRDNLVSKKLSPFPIWDCIYK